MLWIHVLFQRAASTGDDDDEMLVVDKSTNSQRPVESLSQKELKKQKS